MYKYAKNPSDQIDILAELCSCSRNEMAAFLSGVMPIVRSERKHYFNPRGFNEEQAAYMYDHGATYTEIAMEVGATIDQIRGFLARLREERRKNGY